jgi:hypothetical protein
MAVTDKPPSARGTAGAAPAAEDDSAPAQPGGPGTGGPGTPGPGTRGPGTLRRGLPAALELLALTAFVIARPVFGSFGRSPETFMARGADWTDVIVFGLVVLLAPALVLIVAEVVVGLVAGERVRRLCHLAAVAALLAVAVWQIVESLVDWESGLGVPVSLAAGLVVALLWARFASVATFVRYASVGALVFLVQFLALSPVSSIVFGGRHAAADVGAVGLGDDAPPVVLVVLDGLPTELLLDGSGAIDAALYPNLASLAGDATWYRNHTTVAQVTLEAVPAILSGSQPSPDQPPALAGNYPDNIFTLLGASHDVHGAEAITGLCPVEVCAEPAGSPLGGLLRDAGRIWRLQMSDTAIDPEVVPYVFSGRYDRADDWIAEQDFDAADGPGLHVLHLLVPHPAWEYLPDGSRYAGASRQPQGLVGDSWSGWGADVGRQRHVLQTQAADRLLGELLDGLRADDAYDDALIAVTADHGYSFAEGAPWRALDEDNYDQIMWTPLIIKAPGQQAAAVDDSNVNSLDILPTIAAELGIDELPWDADGRPAGTVERDPEDKWIVDWSYARLHPDDDGDRVRVDGVEGFERVLAADPVEGTGPLAVWGRTEYGELVGAEVGDLEVGDATGDVLSVRDLDAWDDVDTDRPRLELVGRGPVPSDAAVAVTVDGVVAAVVPPSPTPYGISLVHALLWPGALGERANEIGAYVVDGPPTAPVLHELEVEARVGDG